MIIQQNKLNIITSKLVASHDPEKIILFGSQIWGGANKDSDVDLLIIKKTNNTFKTSREIDGSIFPRPFPIDILVYTPQQICKRTKAGDIFIKDILSNGKILYEKTT